MKHEFTFTVETEEGVTPQQAMRWLYRVLEGTERELPDEIYSVQTVPTWKEGN